MCVTVSLALSGEMLAEASVIPSDTVQILRRKVALSSGLDPSTLRLIFKDRSLSTLSTTLAEVGLHRGSRIEACKVICGSCCSDNPDEASKAWTHERNIEDGSPLDARIAHCHSCGRWAVRILAVLVDREAGRDGMAAVIVPLSEDERRAAQAFQNVDEIHQLFEHKPPCRFLLRRRPRGRDGDPGWQWRDQRASCLMADVGVCQPWSKSRTDRGICQS